MLLSYNRLGGLGLALWAITILVCLFLILVVLLQAGKGGGSYTTKGGSTIDYKGAAVGGSTGGGSTGGGSTGEGTTTPGATTAAGEPTDAEPTDAPS